MCDVQTILQPARAFRAVRNVTKRRCPRGRDGVQHHDGRMQGKQPFDAWQMEAIAEALHIPPEEYSKYFFDHAKAAK